MMVAVGLGTATAVNPVNDINRNVTAVCNPCAQDIPPHGLLGHMGYTFLKYIDSVLIDIVTS